MALKAKGKKQKYQYIELDNYSNGELEDKADDGGKGDDESTIANSAAEQGGEEGVNVVVLPPSPYSGDWQLPLQTCPSYTVKLTPPQEARIMTWWLMEN